MLPEVCHRVCLTLCCVLMSKEFFYDVWFLSVTENHMCNPQLQVLKQFQIVLRWLHVHLTIQKVCLHLRSMCQSLTPAYCSIFTPEQNYSLATLGFEQQIFFCLCATPLSLMKRQLQRRHLSLKATLVFRCLYGMSFSGCWICIRIGDLWKW